MTSVQKAKRKHVPEEEQKESKYTKSFTIESATWSGAGKLPDIKITWHGVWAQAEMNYALRSLRIAYQERRLQQYHDTREKAKEERVEAAKELATTLNVAEEGV
jgi:hypothetical protein